MAKKKVPVKGKATQRPKAANATPIPRVPRGLRLSESEADYARLLADPCNGPLVPGLFGDGNGSVVARFEADYTLLVGSTDTAGAFLYVPSQSALYQFNTTSDTVNGTWGSAYVAPGQAFLSTKGRFRPLAACMQIFYSGSELSRQGFVGVANVDASAVLETQSAAKYRTSCPTVVRMPSDSIEIRWRPTEADIEWKTAGQLDATTTFGKNNALLGTVSGIPVSTGVRVRIVLVAEYQDKIANGTTVVNQYPNHDSKGSTFNWQKALQWLDNGGNWLVQHGATLAKSAVNMAVAAM